MARPSVADRARRVRPAAGARRSGASGSVAGSELEDPVGGHGVGGGSDLSRGRASRSRASKRDPIPVRRRAQPIEDPAAEPAVRRRRSGWSAGACAGRARRPSRASRPAARGEATPRPRRAGVAPGRAGPAEGRPDVHEGVGPVARPVGRDRVVGDVLERRRRQRDGIARDDPPEHATDVDIDRADRARRTRAPRPRAPCTARRRGAPGAPPRSTGCDRRARRPRSGPSATAPGPAGRSRDPATPEGRPRGWPRRAPRPWGTAP